MMVASTSHMLGAADILVNNAGVYPRVTLLEMRETDWGYLRYQSQSQLLCHHCLRQGANGIRPEQRFGRQYLLAGKAVPSAACTTARARAVRSRRAAVQMPARSVGGGSLGTRRANASSVGTGMVSNVLTPNSV
jgi:NAD(P)-dependent dehydrogenase (short-subunit alcohol dehydrogenase family)